MSKTETKSRSEAGLPLAATPADEVKTALAGFMTEITDRIKKQDERLTMLDRKATHLRRPALAQSAELEAPHQKAFEAYVRTGDDDALRGLALEEKALSTAVAADGGYLVDPETAQTIQSVMNSTASIRQIANVVNVEATAFDVLVDRTDVGAGWASETASSVETDTPILERISIPLHELSALPKVSQRLLDDSAFDIDAWLADRIADKFARAEAGAFVGGDGADKPRGFLNHSNVAEASWSWGTLGYVATGEDGD